jgi:poly(A) polymerase
VKLRDLLANINEITTDLGLSSAFICGGVARSKVMGNLKDISDLDITTGDKSIQYLAKELAVLLGRHYSFDQKMMPDGHTSIMLGNLKIDFSSNFTAPNIDAILKEKGIDDPSDLQREMFSRDFTCNALLLDTSLKNVLDPTGQGIRDVHAKIIRTCLDPSITFTVNKNRVVRAIYLAAKLNFDLDSVAADWIRSNPTSIKVSSTHTLVEKLNRAVQYNGDKTASLLTDLNLWDQIPITELLQPYYEQHIAKSISPKP